MRKLNMFRLLVPCLPVFGCALLGGPAKQQVTMGSLDPVFGMAASASGMKEDPVVKASVTYPVVGNAKYDEFFKKSAEVKGSMVASRAFATATMENMKATARSAAAKGALDDSIKEVVGDKPDSNWTAEETAAIIKLERKRGAVAADQLSGIGQSAASITGLAAFLAKVPITSKDLASQGSGLAGSVRQDFTGPQAAKAPEISAALNDSAVALREAGEAAPATAKELTRLGNAIKMALE